MKLISRFFVAMLFLSSLMIFGAVYGKETQKSFTTKLTRGM